jgi:hypothetical protein
VKVGSILLMHYRFNVIGDNRVFLDDAGESFPSAAAATSEAAKIARDLASEGDAYRGYEITVVDDTGAEVARVAVADGLQEPGARVIPE